MARRLLALSAFLTLSFVLLARADEPAPAPGPDSPAGEKQKSLEQQEILNRQFREFEASLLRLEQRLAKSSKPEDRERAANLKKALDLASERNDDTKFERLISILQESRTLGMREIEQAMEQNQMLAEDIRDILKFLLTDNRDDELRREKERLANLIKQIDEAIRNQKIVRSHTDGGRMETDPLAKLQNQAAKNTEEIARAMGKDGKNASAKDAKDAKSGDSKDGKSGDAKDGKDGKDGKGQDGKDGKGQDSKDGKGQDSKDGKGQDSKDGKGQDSKDGKGQDSKDGKGQDSKGQGQKGQGQPGQGSQGQPGQGQQGQDDNQQDSTPGRKQVQDANKYQRQSEEDIRNQKRQEASNKQDKAIDLLEQAKKRLEEILRQLREEEVERKLAALQARCERMLQLQIAVWEGTVRLDEVIAKHTDKKPERVDEQKSIQYSDREGDIIKEADKAIELLRDEGTAVAFPEVFVQVRDDMTHVARRLGKVDVGPVTQVIEKDIIATLKDMIDALKKQRQQMDAQKGKPSPPGQPQPQALINLLNELKMIRAMQVRVNDRTVTYARQYVDKEGEETRDPDIQKELKELSDRQEKIFEVTNNIYRGKNR